MSNQLFETKTSVSESKRGCMNELLQKTLYQCIEQCTALEQLLDSDIEDMSSCVSGEIHTQYALLLDETKARVVRLRRKIQSKYDESMTII